MKDHYYRLIVTYWGFDEKKDEWAIRAAQRDPSQQMYSPVENRRSMDFVYDTSLKAARARTRLVDAQQRGGGFSVSRVIDDTF
jgi:hypothetical protein